MSASEAAKIRHVALTERLLVPLVTAYLIAVGTWLVLTRRVPPPGLLRVLRARWRPAYSATLAGIAREQGHGYIAQLPSHLLSDRESVSRLMLYEDGRALGPAHAAHCAIRDTGQGRFSHWGAQIYFSASDNSDPTTNGRVYTVRESAQ